jgi:hypothetical protein
MPTMTHSGRIMGFTSRSPDPISLSSKLVCENIQEQIHMIARYKREYTKIKRAMLIWQ